MTPKKEIGKYSILIVDDHQFARMALRVLLTPLQSIRVIDEASTLDEGIRTAQQKDYSLILLDLDLPDSNGLQTLSTFEATCPNRAIAMISGDGTIATMAQAMSGNILGYIVKSQPPEVISAAIALMLAGGRYVPPDLFAAVSAAPVAPQHDKSVQRTVRHIDLVREQLTPRLRDVFDLVVEGRTNREISEALRLSHGTVKNYVSLIFERLNVPNRPAAISHVMRSASRRTEE